MAVTTNRTARLTFTTTGGNTLSLTVPKPREDILLTEAMDVMNSLIAGGIFLTTNGTLTGVRDIKVIETAWYLIHSRLSLSQILSLIKHSGDGEEKIVPQLSETIAWIASMNQDVFAEVMKTDPEVLLRSDMLSTNNQLKPALVVLNAALLYDRKFD